MKVNSGQAPSTLIPEYIGSDFDAVLACADNIEYIKNASASTGHIGNTPPTQPKAGASWYCTLDGKTYVWYEDADSGQWVESSPQGLGEVDSSIELNVNHNTDNIFTLWKRSAAEAGYNLVAGSFEEGGALISSNDVLLHKESKRIYAWSGVFPKVVNAGLTPATSGGIGAGAWVDRSLDRASAGETYFASREEFKAHVTSALTYITEGSRFTVDGVAYKCVRGSLDIPDMPNISPCPPYNILHWGAKRVVWDVENNSPLNANFDNGACLQQAFNFAKTQLNTYLKRNGGVIIHIPEGEWHFDTKAEVIVSPLPNTDKGEVTLTVKGAGSTNTVLVANANNSSGIMKFVVARNLEIVNVEGFTLLSDLDQSVSETRNNGIGLEIYNSLFGSDGYGDKANWGCTVKDVRVGGYGYTHSAIHTRGNWLKGIHIYGMWHPVLQDVHAKARMGVTEITSPRNACTHAIHVNECYSPELTNIYIQGRWQHGIWVEGGEFEDFRMVNIFCAGPEYGVGVVHPNAPDGALTEPGGAIIGAHINAGRRGLSIISHHQIMVDDFYIYAPSQADSDEFGDLLPSAIYLEQASDVRLFGGIYEPGFYTSDINASVGIRLERQCEGVISDVQFGHGGIGVLNNSTMTSRKSILIKSDMPTSRRLEALWAPYKTMVDNAGTATLIEHTFGATQDRLKFLSGKYNSSSYSSALRVGASHPDQVYAGAYEFAAKNLSGEDKILSIIRSHMADRTAGAERGIIDFFTLLDGGTVNPLRIIPQKVNDSTAMQLLCYINNAFVIKTVFIGAADSGGTGFRSLRIIN